MTGRLNKVDLQQDLVLVVLLEADRPLGINDLHGRLHAIDPEPFVFDTIFEQTTSLLESLAMFEEVHHLAVEDGVVELTERGRLMADHLEAELTPAQEAAVDEAFEHFTEAPEP